MRIRVTTPTISFEYSPPAGVNDFSLGRQPGNDVILEGSQLAADLHVRVQRFVTRWSFTDQFTNRGTLLNGEHKFTGDLKAGDVLTLGDCQVEIVKLAATAESNALPTAAERADPLFAAYLATFPADPDREPELAEHVRALVARTRAELPEDLIRDRVIPALRGKHSAPDNPPEINAMLGFDQPHDPDSDDE